jgi:hypothetical protein
VPNPNGWLTIIHRLASATVTAHYEALLPLSRAHTSPVPRARLNVFLLSFSSECISSRAPRAYTPVRARTHVSINTNANERTLPVSGATAPSHLVAHLSMTRARMTTNGPTNSTISCDYDNGRRWRIDCSILRRVDPTLAVPMRATLVCLLTRISRNSLGRMRPVAR